VWTDKTREGKMAFIKANGADEMPLDEDFAVASGLHRLSK
jgi:hypothetical protein